MPHCTMVAASLQCIVRKLLAPTFFSVSVDLRLDNLESGKRNYCFGKKSGKFLEFWS